MNRFIDRGYPIPPASRASISMLPWMMHGKNAGGVSVRDWAYTCRNRDFSEYAPVDASQDSLQNPIACPRIGDGLDPASQATGLTKMPSAEALEALAAISSHPLDDNEQVLVRIIDLLIVGGFRIGEALTLPRDCWVEETVLDARGQPRTPDWGRESL